ncbi:hypothetical protein O3M35_008541 [Rhynocoris fuscipes]|uniref:Glycosyltransferase n=1 Tax=Rhynocoris fuscipes TaxID=488301 RepID=A0AAW1D6N5_9HEMI
MYRVWLVSLLISVSVISLYLIYIDNIYITKTNYNIVTKTEYNKVEDFDNFDNITGTKDGCYIVPNIVHFIRFNQKQLSFIDLVCILAAYKHQKPDHIYIHTNVLNFKGKYWEYLLTNNEIINIIKIKYLDMPTQIFGQQLSKQFLVFHSGDIARLKILMKYGGIYLDNDSYIVRNMNDLRKYEISIGWRENGNISNQVIITNKNARFLKLWLESYRNAYNSKSWFYNAGIRPTQEILLKDPSLVHREKVLLAPYDIIGKMYETKWPEWRHYYTVHLMINHQYLLRNLSEKATYPVQFNETNIKLYPIAFRDMVYDVYPFDIA